MAPRILVVDDEPDLEALISQKFRRQIRKGELSFLFAHDGQHALEVLDEHADVDMVLSDINMPRMDGLTLLDRLAELHDDLRAVIVSAYGDMENIRAAMNRGAFDFLTKPIQLDDLQTTIEKTLVEMAKLRAIQQARLAAEEAKKALSRYFSPSVVEQLETNPGAIRAGGQRQVVTFLFTDLADFTGLVESTEPDVIVSLLNEYLDGLTEIVFQHQGTVIKVVGDAIHAMFGAPVEQSDHAARAVRCAMAIDVFAERFRGAKREEGIELGVTRIGVNTGGAIVGNFGGDRFFDYTAHGDSINVAARLESVNKQLGTRVCVSETTVRAIDGFRGRPVGELVLKGRTEPLGVYEPVGDSEHDEARLRAYAAAYEKMREEDPGASQAFAALVGQFGDDALATFHLRRLLAGERGVRIEMPQK